MGCGSCVVTCPAGALRMQVVHDVDWIPITGQTTTTGTSRLKTLADYNSKAAAGQD